MTITMTMTTHRKNILLFIPVFFYIYFFLIDPPGTCSQITTCGGFDQQTHPNETCSGHGVCTGNETCVCDDLVDYLGDYCEFWRCFGESNDSWCSGNGNCTDHDRCECFEGYFENNCSVHTCAGIRADLVFGDLGITLDENSTESEYDYLLPCSNHGDCVSLDSCVCDYSYNSDTNCSVQQDLFLLFFEDNWFFVILASVIVVLSIIVVPLLFLERVYFFIMEKKKMSYEKIAKSGRESDESEDEDEDDGEGEEKKAKTEIELKETGGGDDKKKKDKKKGREKKNKKDRKDRKEKRRKDKSPEKKSDGGEETIDIELTESDL